MQPGPRQRCGYWVTEMLPRRRLPLRSRLRRWRATPGTRRRPALGLPPGRRPAGPRPVEREADRRALGRRARAATSLGGFPARLERVERQASATPIRGFLEAATPAPRCRELAQRGDGFAPRFSRPSGRHPWASVNFVTARTTGSRWRTWSATTSKPQPRGERRGRATTATATTCPGTMRGGRPDRRPRRPGAARAARSATSWRASSCRRACP